MFEEELRYILARQQSNKFIRNALIRPLFLIKPLQHKSTSNKTEYIKQGTKNGTSFNETKLFQNEHEKKR